MPDQNYYIENSKDGIRKVSLKEFLETFDKWTKAKIRFWSMCDYTTSIITTILR
jgi:hypothetical protein